MGRSRSYRARNHRRQSSLILLAGLITLVPMMRGQIIEINPTISSTAAPLPADDTPSGNGLFTSQFGPNKGPLQYALHLSLRGAYDDNIGLTHMNRLDDGFVQIQPSLMLGVGDVAKEENFILVNYLPSFYRYDEHTEFDSDQHVVRLIVGYKNSNLIIRLTQDVAILNNTVLAASSSERQSLVPTGRTDLDIYSTDLSANYNMTPHDFLFAEVRMLRTEYEAPLISNEVYATDLYLNHGFGQSLVLGLGVYGGYDAVDFPTPDQTFVQANVHMNFTPNAKFSVDVIAGGEFRNFEDIGRIGALQNLFGQIGEARPAYSTPVFLISSAWLPCENTRITVSAARQIYDSAARSAQDYVDTNVTGQIRERVCKQFYLGVIGGWEHVQYFNTIDFPVPPLTLHSDYYYIQPSADLILTRWWSLGAYYLRRQNSGSVSTVDFYSNEYGGRMVIKF
jgi:hypothetical protein